MVGVVCCGVSFLCGWDFFTVLFCIWLWLEYRLFLGTWIPEACGSERVFIGFTGEIVSSTLVVAISSSVSFWSLFAYGGDAQRGLVPICRDKRRLSFVIRGKKG